MALESLRHASDNIDFWIDALCIDQFNVEERNLQVLRMTSIYRQAEEVVAWIGPEPDQGVNPLEQLFVAEELQIESTLSATISAPEPCLTQQITIVVGDSGDRPGKYSSTSLPNIATPREISWLTKFIGIFSLPYWTRIWMIQELAVASKIRVACGSKSIDWEKLCNLVESASQGRYKDDEVVISQNHHYQHVIGYSGFRTFRYFQFLSSDRQPLPLVEAIHKTSTFLSKDFRDRIYALLGISFDAAMFVPLPNYVVPRETFVPRMVKSYIRNTGVLDIICIRGRSRDNNCSLPSWCPDLLNSFDSTAKFESDYVFKRVASQKFKAASINRHQFGRNDDTSVLSVQGILLDTVEGLGTEYGRQSEQTAFSTDYQLQQPTRVLRKLKQIIEYELGMAVEYGSQLDIGEYEEPKYFKLGSRVFKPAGKLKILMNRRGNSFQSLSLFEKVRTAGKLVNRVDRYRGYRTFDTANLSTWIAHNKDLIIHNCSFEQWARAPAKIYFWAWELFLFIALTSTTIVLLFALPAFCFASGIIACFVYMSANHASFIRKKQSVTLRAVDRCLGASHMRLAITRDGRVGLGHAQSRVGDKIFILKGCTVPVILREFEDGFKVVGLCYFAGEMFGENLDSERWEIVKLH